MEIEAGETITKLYSPMTCILAGATSLGKTTLIFDILKHSNEIFSIPPKRLYTALVSGKDFSKA